MERTRSTGGPSRSLPREMPVRRWALRITLGFTVAAQLMIFVAKPARAESIDAKAEARIAEADAGRATIDVSNYPATLQQSYEIFSDKCSECHTLSRPINSGYALADEWQRYVKRMMRKPDSGISSSEAKQIYEFLVYDAAERRPELVEKKLTELDDDSRREAEQKISEIRQKYGNTTD